MTLDWRRKDPEWMWKWNAGAHSRASALVHTGFQRQLASPNFILFLFQFLLSIYHLSLPRSTQQPHQNHSLSSRNPSLSLSLIHHTMLLLHYSVIYLFPCYVICSRRFSATAMDNPKGQESPSVLDEEAFALPSKLLQEFTSMSTIDKAWLFKPDTHTGGNGNAKSLSSFLILLYFNLVSCYLLMMMEIRYFQLLLRECFA